VVGIQGRLLPLSALVPSAPLLLEHVSKSFGPTRAVDGLELRVEAGLVAALAGPNGSGKTTALRLVVGLERPDAGRVLVDGAPAGSLPARRACAFVPDEPHGLDELTVRELLALVRALHRLESRGLERRGADDRFEARAARLLDAFGLAPRAGVRLGALSHGLRRQASIVAAAALAPRLLVVDEATATLDPEAVIVLRETLRALARRGSGVLVATQDLHFAEQVADTVFLLNRGRLVAHGSVAALLSRYGAATLEAALLAAVGRPELVESVRESLDAL
jgi:ABC-2 type transport system ATP-binding protein